MYSKTTHKNQDNTFTMTIIKEADQVAQFVSMLGESKEAFLTRADNLCADVIPNELDEQFLFSCTATDLLTKIVNGEIDAKELAWKALRNRGQDVNGLWVGFGEGKCKKPF